MAKSTEVLMLSWLNSVCLPLLLSPERRKGQMEDNSRFPRTTRAGCARGPRRALVLAQEGGGQDRLLEFQSIGLIGVLQGVIAGCGASLYSWETGRTERGGGATTVPEQRLNSGIANGGIAPQRKHPARGRATARETRAHLTSVPPRVPSSPRFHSPPAPQPSVRLCSAHP